MALSFPLSVSDFLGRLRVQDVEFSCPPQRQITGLAGGEILSAEVGPALWQGTVTLATMRAQDAAQVEALLGALEVPGRAFMAYKATERGPAGDPAAAAISGAAVEVHAVDPGASALQLRGLPPGYSLAPGDRLAFTYGAPIRYALHRVQEPITAAANGITPFFQVGPHLRQGVAAGAAVTLDRPACKAVLVPGSVNFGVTRLGKTSGMAFGWRQSLR